MRFVTDAICRLFQVKLDLMKQGNEYEVIEFLVNRMKLMTGIGKPKLNSVGPLAPTSTDESVSKVSVNKHASNGSNNTSFLR